MKPHENRRAAFTLIELMASISILGLLVFVLFAAFNQASKAWIQGENRVETFQQARAALDDMSKELTQAMASTNISFLGSLTNVAFIAPINTGTNAVDIEEVVYVLTTNSPPSLVRRVSAFGSADCTTFNGGVCPTTAWDFYPDVALNYRNWPETFDPTRTAVLAEHVTSIRFEFVATNGTAYPFWNSIGTPAVT